MSLRDWNAVLIVLNPTEVWLSLDYLLSHCWSHAYVVECHLGHILRHWRHRLWDLRNQLWRRHGIDCTHYWRCRLRLRIGLLLGREGRRIGLLGFGKLLKERLRRVEFERQGRFTDRHGRCLLSHLLTLEISLKSIKEESIMGDTIPVKDFLLLLRPNAIVLVQEVKETTLWLFQGGISARFQVSQIRKDTLLEFLRVLHGATKCLESKRKTSDNIRARNVKEIIPIKQLALLFPDSN
jgi:hypothetical protein